MGNGDDPASAAAADPPDNSPRELRVRVRQGELISEFSRLALSGADIDALLDAAARLAAEGLGAPLAKVMQHEPGEDSLLVRAGVGWRPGVVGHARLGADLESPAGYALKTGAPVISNHLDTEDRFRTPALMVEHGARRAVNVVVRGQREPFGVLEVDSRDPAHFSRRDVVFLEALAGVLGLAVDREADAAQREALLRDKDLLMAEVHHRVRNSLFLVQGLLAPADPRRAAARGARRAGTGDPARVLHRRGAPAALQRQSPRPDRRGRVPRVVAARHGRLCRGPRDPARRAGGAELERGPRHHLRAGGDGAGHQRPEVRRGTVAVRVEPAPRRRTASRWRTKGAGPAPGFDPANSTGLGMRILRALLRGGRLEFDRSAGHARFVARLPATSTGAPVRGAAGSAPHERGPADA